MDRFSIKKKFDDFFDRGKEKLTDLNNSHPIKLPGVFEKDSFPNKSVKIPLNVLVKKRGNIYIKLAEDSALIISIKEVEASTASYVKKLEEQILDMNRDVRSKLKTKISFSEYLENKFSKIVVEDERLLRIEKDILESPFEKSREFDVGDRFEKVYIKNFKGSLDRVKNEYTVKRGELVRFLTKELYVIFLSVGNRMLNLAEIKKKEVIERRNSLKSTVFIEELDKHYEENVLDLDNKIKGLGNSLETNLKKYVETFPVEEIKSLISIDEFYNKEKIFDKLETEWDKEKIATYNLLKSSYNKVFQEVNEEIKDYTAKINKNLKNLEMDFEKNVTSVNTAKNIKDYKVQLKLHIAELHQKHWKTQNSLEDQIAKIESLIIARGNKQLSKDYRAINDRMNDRLQVLLGELVKIESLYDVVMGAKRDIEIKTNNLKIQFKSLLNLPSYKRIEKAQEILTSVPKRFDFNESWNIPQINLEKKEFEKAYKLYGEELKNREVLINKSLEEIISIYGNLEKDIVSEQKKESKILGRNISSLLSYKLDKVDTGETRILTLEKNLIQFEDNTKKILDKTIKSSIEKLKNMITNYKSDMLTYKKLRDRIKSIVNKEEEIKRSLELQLSSNQNYSLVLGIEEKVVYLGAEATEVTFSFITQEKVTVVPERLKKLWEDSKKKLNKIRDEQILGIREKLKSNFNESLEYYILEKKEFEKTLKSIDKKIMSLDTKELPELISLKEFVRDRTSLEKELNDLEKINVLKKLFKKRKFRKNILQYEGGAR